MVATCSSFIMTSQTTRRSHGSCKMLHTGLPSQVHASVVKPSKPPSTDMPTGRNALPLVLKSGAKTQLFRCSQRPNFSRAIECFAQDNFSLQTSQGQQVQVGLSVAQCYFTYHCLSVIGSVIYIVSHYSQCKASCIQAFSPLVSNSDFLGTWMAQVQIPALQPVKSCTEL